MQCKGSSVRETGTARDAFRNEAGASSMITMLMLWTATLPHVLPVRAERPQVLLKRLMHELKTHGCAVDGNARREFFVSRVDGTKLIGVAYNESGINYQGPYELTIHASEGELCIDNQHGPKLLLRLKDFTFTLQEKGKFSGSSVLRAGVYPYRFPDDFAPLSRIPAVTATARRLDDASASEKEARVLVSELGSSKYRERAAAEKQLLEMGEGIVPLLRKIDTAIDLEVENRLKRIRQRLTKYDVMASLENKVRFVPDFVKQTTTPSLVGEVRLRGQGFATRDDLQIILDLYAIFDGDIVPHERWIIGPDHLSKPAKEGEAGLDCKIVLPLSRYSPNVRLAKLRVRVTSAREEAADAGQLEPELRNRVLPTPWGKVLGESIIEIHTRDGAEERMVPPPPPRPLDKQ